MEIGNTISSVLLSLSLILTFIRLVKGPHSVDRVLCLDLLALIVAGMMSLHAIRIREKAFLDAALVISIIAFLSTVVLARLIEGFLDKRKDVSR